MTLNISGNNAVYPTGFSSSPGVPAHQPAQAQLGTGNLNGKPFAANNAGGPASTGPGALVAGLKSFGKLVATPALAVAGRVAANREASASRQAHAGARAASIEMKSLSERDNLRSVLGQVGGASILNEPLQAKGADNGKTIGVLMEQYRAALESDSKGHQFTRATAAEVQTWVAMGEKICHHINNNPGVAPATMTYNGQTVQVPANLDTMRAVAWYLTAQAMKDNQGPNNAPLNVASGTFILKDQNNAIMKFFASSDKVYGRYSSHFNDGRADSGANLRPATAREGFTKPFLGTLGGQGLQNGIEDFTRKFPGNGGTMLFERLKADSTSQMGGEELFLKFESVGVPDALGDTHKMHGDVDAEKATKMQALVRCFGHAKNFVGIPMFKEHKHADMTNRGEHTDKFFNKAEMKDVGSLLNDKHAGHKPVYEIRGELDNVRTNSSDPQARTTAGSLMIKIDSAGAAGLGINRQGAEVHLNPSASLQGKQFDRL